MILHQEPMAYEPGNLPPVPHRMTPEALARWREHEADDLADAARDCEAEEGRYGVIEGLLSWPTLISAVVVGAMAAAVIVVTMGSAL